MRLTYSPDTCQCMVIFETDGEIFDSYIQKCFIHKKFENQEFLNEVLIHNRNFSLSGDPTEQVIIDNQITKKTEFLRIKTLGDPKRNV